MRKIDNYNYIKNKCCREISTSQLDFFKMLDEKIENVSIASFRKYVNPFNSNRTASLFPVNPVFLFVRREIVGLVARTLCLL